MSKKLKSITISFPMPQNNSSITISSKQILQLNFDNLQTNILYFIGSDNVVNCHADHLFLSVSGHPFANLIEEQATDGLDHLFVTLNYDKKSPKILVEGKIKLFDNRLAVNKADNEQTVYLLANDTYDLSATKEGEGVDMSREMTVYQNYTDAKRELEQTVAKIQLAYPGVKPIHQEFSDIPILGLNAYLITAYAYDVITPHGPLRVLVRLSKSKVKN